MNPEKFNPSNLEYKEVKDLPQEEQKNFVDVEGGFVGKEAVEYAESAGEDAALKNKRRGILQKLFNVNEVSELDMLHEDAISEDISREDSKQEERRKKEEEEHEAVRQARAEEERILEEKWKNSEEFKKLSLFEEFLATKPEFREVRSILFNFSKNYFDNRTEPSLKLLKKARRSTYKKCFPFWNYYSIEKAVTMPSDPSGIDDDLKFISETRYERSQSDSNDYYDVARRDDDKNYIDIYKMSHYKDYSLINSSLAIAAIHDYYKAGHPAHELEKYARSLLKNAEHALGAIEGSWSNNGVYEYPPYRKLSEAFNLEDSKGESISGRFPGLDSQLMQLKKQLEKISNMDRHELDQFKKRAAEDREKRAEFEKIARQEAEESRINKERVSAENAEKQRELANKLLS